MYELKRSDFSLRLYGVDVQHSNMARPCATQGPRARRSGDHPTAWLRFGIRVHFGDRAVSRWVLPVFMLREKASELE